MMPSGDTEPLQPDLRGYERIAHVLRTVARELIGADGVTLVLKQGGECVYVEEDAVGPLWKGQRFPLQQCVSGWVIANGVPAVIPDVYADPRVPVDAYRATFVRSMAMVPIGSPTPVGAIGAYWATRHDATESEIDTLRTLAESAALAGED
jgi:two-component system CheB/CheR fusion protein